MTTELKATDRLSQLQTPERKAAHSKGYTRFVRSMRLFLPLAAAGLIGLVISWSNVEDTFEAIPQESALPQSVGQNELINPSFKSRDEKQQPYTVTAERAFQSAKDMNLVLLELPKADITLTDGAWLAAKAEKGVYRQNAENLILDGDVRLFHDKGYEMTTERMLINLKTRKAISDRAVHGQGPAGTIDATGFQASGENNSLIFTGPVKLVLNRRIKGIGG
jgi:lipopolysaccharide export system protein LptC